MRTGGLDAPFLFISFILFYLFIFYLMTFAWIRMRLLKKETGCVVCARAHVILAWKNMFVWPVQEVQEIEQP